MITCVVVAVPYPVYYY